MEIAQVHPVSSLFFLDTPSVSFHSDAFFLSSLFSAIYYCEVHGVFCVYFLAFIIDIVAFCLVKWARLLFFILRQRWGVVWSLISADYKQPRTDWMVALTYLYIPESDYYILQHAQQQTPFSPHSIEAESAIAEIIWDCEIQLLMAWL